MRKQTEYRNLWDISIKNVNTMISQGWTLLTVSADSRGTLYHFIKYEEESKDEG